MSYRVARKHGASLALGAMLTGALVVAWAQSQEEDSSAAEPIVLGAILGPEGDVETSATGTAALLYDPATRELQWRIDYSDFGEGVAATVSHFHGPVEPDAPPDASAGIALNIALGGSPDNPLPNPLVGSDTLSEQQAEELLAGRWYINIHTTRVPQGEIRGRVTQGTVLVANLVPDSLEESPGSGRLFALFDPTTRLLQWHVELSGIESHVNDARFHGSPGVSAPVSLQAPEDSDLLRTSAVLNEEQAAELLAGQWSFNVTSNSHPEGEIHGQVAVADVASLLSSETEDLLAPEAEESEPLLPLL